MTLTELLETQDDGPVLLLAQLLTPSDRLQMLSLCRAVVHSQLRQFHFEHTNWELPASFAVARQLVERLTMSHWIRTISMADPSCVPLLSAFPSLQFVRIGHASVGQAAAAEGTSAIPSAEQTMALAALPLVALDLRQTAIADVASLAHLQSLRRLDLSRTRVRDISALRALPQLTHLNLEDTLVISIAFVSAMPGLLSLNVNRTSTLYDLSPLTHLTQLQELHSNGKKLMDLAFFDAFAATLRVLELRRVRLITLTPGVAGAAILSSLTQLTSLVLQRCTLITTLEPLAGLVHLQHLDISDSEFADLAPLASLAALESLTIDTDGVRDFSPLAELRNLRQLTQNGFLSTDETDGGGGSSSDSVLTHLPRLETLCGPMTLPDERNALPALTHLEVDNYSDKELPLHIHSAPNLHTLFARGAFDLSSLPLWAPKLTQLTLSRAVRVNFDAIAQLTQLELLNLSFTTSSNASSTSYVFLQPLKQLRDLRLYQHSIRDLSVLSGLAKLQALDLDSTDVEDISPLSALSELQNLDLADTRVTDVRSLCTLTKLRAVFLPPCADCQPLRHARLPALKKVWHPTVNCLWHEHHAPQDDE